MRLYNSSKFTGAGSIEGSEWFRIDWKWSFKIKLESFRIFKDIFKQITGKELLFGSSVKSTQYKKLAPKALPFIYSEKATKFCEIFTLLLTVCTVVKSEVKISQNFVAFSEYMNYNSEIMQKLTFSNPLPLMSS